VRGTEIELHPEHHRLLAVVFAGILLSAAPARADRALDDTVSRLREQGKACYRKRDYRCALSRFQEALDLRADPAMRFNVASAQDKLGMAVEAVRQYHRYLREAGSDAPETARRHIHLRLTSLLAQVARLRLAVSPTDARIEIDGKAVVPRPPPRVSAATPTSGAAPSSRPSMPELVLAPGSHELAVTAPEREPHRRTLTLAAGEVHTLELALVVVAHGTLDLESEPPGVAVWIDAKRQPAPTPTVTALTPGWHTLLLATETETYRSRVLIERGRRLKLRARLRPVTARLEVHSKPPGAEVRLDGTPVGVAPAVLDGVPAGRHVVVVRKAGHHPERRSLTVTGRTPASRVLQVQLRPRTEDAEPLPPQMLRPMFAYNRPVESAVLSTGVRMFFDYSSDLVSAYNLGFDTRYTVGDRVELGLVLPLLIHGLVLRDGMLPEEKTAVGNIEARTTVRLAGHHARRIAFAGYLGAILPTTSLELPTRSVVVLRPGLAVTGRASIVTLGGDTGVTATIREGEDVVQYGLNGYVAVAPHRIVSLQLALQLLFLLKPATDEVAAAMTPAICFHPIAPLSIALGARVALGDAGKIAYAKGTGAELQMSLGYWWF
jgi:hypothetical protein